MSAYVDFANIKSSVDSDVIVQMLGLKARQHQDHWRSKCPICKSDDERALVITRSKKLFHCFKCKAGGDLIQLVAKAQQLSAQDAAHAIARFAGIELASSVGGISSGTGTRKPVPPSPMRAGFDPDKYLRTLDPAAEALTHLGITAETFREWKAGYSASGVNRGKLALPVVRNDGTIVGYVGRTLKDETPYLSFPHGLAPQEYIFGADRVREGDLYLLRDPLDVLRAFERGVDNAVSFLTQQMTAQQLEILSALMDERRCESVELY